MLALSKRIELLAQRNQNVKNSVLSKSIRIKLVANIVWGVTGQCQLRAQDSFRAHHVFIAKGYRNRDLNRRSVLIDVGIDVTKLQRDLPA